MVKVITYGTYDLLHYGHVRLLERAKALGDYLIVAVTSDSFDAQRGKINVQQSVLERVENVKSTGLADEIIIEEYDGQKIDDIKKYDVNIFAVGSDWVGHFDYLQEYCKVVYLDRTDGISSTSIRTKKQGIRIAIVGSDDMAWKFAKESQYVNGAEISGFLTENKKIIDDYPEALLFRNYDELLNFSDAVYISTHPSLHYAQIKKALEQKKHVICESPISLNLLQYEELKTMALENELVLMEAIKTAFSIAYTRMIYLIKAGLIGDVFSVDSVCTSLKDISQNRDENLFIGSLLSWGPTALLPIFQILGTNYLQKNVKSFYWQGLESIDKFTKIDFTYSNAVASIRVGNGVKSEGELIISGTKGYIIVPAPWWKTEYFEARFENQNDNKRFYFKIDGEGIRYEIISFLDVIKSKKPSTYIDSEVAKEITSVIESALVYK